MLDFKYWEDESDNYRNKAGTLLPLWTFSYKKSDNLEVTGLCWNPSYPDLFAVSYGSCKMLPNFKCIIYIYIIFLRYKHSKNYTFYFLDKLTYHNNQSKGMVLLFSLKNPTYPEYVCNAPCEVMCVDIHPKHPHIIVVGLVRGNVAIYNLQSKDSTPTHISTTRNGKHKDIVWRVSFELYFAIDKH